MNASNLAKVGAGVVLAVRLASGQAPLPTAWTGPWELGSPPAGWTFSGLGSTDYMPDYDGMGDGAAKLDSTGDFISIHFTNAAASVSYWIRGLTWTGGMFRVEQSADGVDWAPLHVYTEDMPTNATYQTRFPALSARHIRFNFSEKLGSNVGLDGIAIARHVVPVVAAMAKTGGVAQATVEQATLGRTYVLEATPALDAAPWVEWTVVDTQFGADAPLVLVDLAPTNAMRFYRVRDLTETMPLP
jgi:hypothetical protein